MKEIWYVTDYDNSRLPKPNSVIKFHEELAKQGERIEALKHLDAFGEVCWWLSVYAIGKSVVTVRENGTDHDEDRYINVFVGRVRIAGEDEERCYKNIENLVKAIPAHYDNDKDFKNSIDSYYKEKLENYTN